MPNIRVGILGFGTVGSGVVKLIQENAGLLGKKIGAPLPIAKIADLDLDSPRGVEVEPSCLTSDAEEVVDDPGIQIVVELIGGDGGSA
jgi:homoserine dehydrogenase